MSSAVLQELTPSECMTQLAVGSIGRIGFAGQQFPVVLTVNYRLVDVGGEPVIMLRTRPGSAVHDAPLAVAFQIDGFEPSHRTGWWVLVQGLARRLGNVEADALRARTDVDTWLQDRDAVLVIRPVQISGRRLVDSDFGWSTDVRAYL